MHVFVVMLLGVLFLLPGCMKVGPDFVPPTAPVADSWLQAQDQQISSQSGHHERWWTVFGDPVLNKLVEDAYLQNLSLQIAGLRVLEARAQLGVATGNLYPQQQQLDASALALGASQNAANTATGDLHFKDLNAGFAAGWELDFWGKFRRGVEAADAQYLAAIANYDSIMVTLTAEVARAYILMRTLEKRILLAEESAAIQKRSLEIAENRFDGGLVTELDVQQARSLLANTLAAIPRYHAEYRRVQNALSVLLGIPPTEFSERLSQSSAGIPSPPAEVAVGVPADLLRRRPDVRRAELQAAAQSALIGVAKADLLPHFTLIGSIGLQASESPLTRAGGSHFSDLFDSDSVTYFAGPSLTWDLFNYGRIKNQVRVQDARLQQLVVNYQNTVLNAAREAEDAMAGYLDDQVQARHFSDAVQASRRSVDISSLQYGEGLTDYQRVLDAQRGLTRDQDSLALVQGSVAVNLVNMFQALGGGWQIRSGQEFVNPEIEKEMAERTDWGGLLEQPKAEAAKQREAGDWRWPDW
ncbi:MAG: efflux transporter outer membrane subunit [Deltaproteobacteria bacterium]|jgi:NodT family efflux transporter outer membrane factor (OMF) lipoprotein|nr:efflux transporter outer membrane subunit [Deltaproteobacteria bacterium]